MRKFSFLLASVVLFGVAISVSCSSSFSSEGEREELFTILTDPVLTPLERSFKLQDFVEKFPNSEYADEALYWLGYYQREAGLWLEAVSSWEGLAKDFPKSPLRREALYQAAITLIALSESLSTGSGDNGTKIASVKELRSRARRILIQLSADNDFWGWLALRKLQKEFPPS